MLAGRAQLAAKTVDGGVNLPERRFPLRLQLGDLVPQALAFLLEPLDFRAQGLKKLLCCRQSRGELGLLGEQLLPLGVERGGLRLLTGSAGRRGLLIDSRKLAGNRREARLHAPGFAVLRALFLAGIAQ